MLAVLMYQWSTNKAVTEVDQLTAETALIEKQVRNVSKLVVNEASYAKIYTYENTKSYGWDFYKSQKRALIISNAKVQIAYDLKKMTYDMDPKSKTLRIIYIPEPEISIDPDLTYYNLDNGLTNKFEAKDFNRMKRQIKTDLRKKIIKSELVANAENRLLSELSQIYVLTNSFGWTLEYDGSAIKTKDAWDEILYWC